MDQAEVEVEAMHQVVDDLLEAHADHVDVSDCVDASEQHEVDMDGLIGSLEGHHDTWHDDASMMCGMHEED